jgi:hypothetical protein
MGNLLVCVLTGFKSFRAPDVIGICSFLKEYIIRESPILYILPSQETQSCYASLLTVVHIHQRVSTCV